MMQVWVATIQMALEWPHQAKAMNRAWVLERPQDQMVMTYRDWTMGSLGELGKWPQARGPGPGTRCRTARVQVIIMMVVVALALQMVPWDQWTLCKYRRRLLHRFEVCRIRGRSLVE